MPAKKKQTKKIVHRKVVNKVKKVNKPKKALKIKKVNTVKEQTPGGVYIPPEEPITHHHTCSDCLKTFVHPPDQPSDCTDPTADNLQCPECTQLRKMQHA